MVYLIHISNGMHYIGWTKSRNTLPNRLSEHRETVWVRYPEPIFLEDGRRKNGEKSGNGSTLLAAAVTNGYTWDCVRTWAGKLADRKFERALKRQHKSSSLCPVCNPLGWRKHYPKATKGMKNGQRRFVTIPVEDARPASESPFGNGQPDFADTCYSEAAW